MSTGFQDHEKGEFDKAKNPAPGSNYGSTGPVAAGIPLPATIPVAPVSSGRKFLAIYHDPMDGVSYGVPPSLCRDRPEFRQLTPDQHEAMQQVGDDYTRSCGDKLEVQINGRTYPPGHKSWAWRHSWMEKNYGHGCGGPGTAAVVFGSLGGLAALALCVLAILNAKEVLQLDMLTLCMHLGIWAGFLLFTALLTTIIYLMQRKPGFRMLADFEEKNERTGASVGYSVLQLGHFRKEGWLVALGGP